MSDIEVTGPGDPRIVEKSWGYEIIFANNRMRNYCGKELVFENRTWCSYHYHRIKHETFYIVEGALMIEFGLEGEELPTPDENHRRRVLHAADRFEIPPGLIHRMRSIGGRARLIEASTFDDPDDSYRVIQSGIIEPYPVSR